MTAIPPTVEVDHPNRWLHVVGVAWFIVVALAVLARVLAHGASFGSYDVLSQFGVLRQHGVVVHNIQAGDQSDQIIPWATLAWTQVHSGHLPLWNPYEALGMPLAFNWQSVVLSVPALVGYLFPLRLAYTVQVLLTLIIAGSGAYVLGRVMRLGALASVFAGTVFELSGPMLGWLGWPHAAVLSWSGWLFAAGLLVIRGGRRARSIVFLAVIVAATIYAGQAEIMTLVGISFGVFALAILLQRTAVLGGSGPIRRPILDLAVGAVAGGALGAPLLLPGMQVISLSERAVPGGDPGELIKGNPPLPPHNLVHLVFQGFDGLPIAGNHWFGYPNGYSETAAYVGVITIVLAVVALVVRRRRPDVLALGALVIVMLAIAFLPPVVAVLSHLPVIGTLLWQRALLPLAFGLAMLGGVGMDALVRQHEQRVVRRTLGCGLAIVGLGLIFLWTFGRGDLPSAEAAIRERSFIWPTVQVALGLLVLVALVVARRRARLRPTGRSWRLDMGPWVGLALLLCETAFLITAGAPLWTSTSTPFAPTPAVQELKATVGSSLVALGTPSCFLPPGLAIPENAQIPFGIQELAIYDPMIPSSYYSSWKAVSSQSPGIPKDSVYCPGISTDQLARLYGVSYVLERTGSPGPEGGIFVRTIGDEELFRMPGSGPATLSSLARGGGLPGDSGAATPVPVTHPDPAAWKVVTDTHTPQVLRLRITDVPGWHATIDGTPAKLRSFAGVMLQVEVPAGHHTVELHYWPPRLTVGLVLAAISAIGLVTALTIDLLRSRRRRSSP